MSEEGVIKEYIAGASLIFGIVVLVSQGMGIYYEFKVNLSNPPYNDIVYIVFIFTHLIGGILGGYLVSRKRVSGMVRAGLITALIAYVIEYIYHLIFERVFPGHLEALIATLIGGLIGGSIAWMRRNEGFRPVMKAPSL